MGADEPDYALPWYHGSQQKLTQLISGSSITQRRAVARAFSHRPKLLSQMDDGTIKHDGSMPGYLHVVDEPVRPEDVYPHPDPVNASRWEWLTTRELRVSVIERTAVRQDEALTEAELAELRRMQLAAGRDTFADESR